MVSFLIAHIQCSVRFTHITPGHWTFMYSTAAISALGTNRTHRHLFHVRVKCLVQGHNIETISHYWEGRNMLFLWKSCTKRDSKPHAGSEIVEVPRYNHCATSICRILSGQVHYNEVSTQYIELSQHILSLFSRYLELTTQYIKFTTQSIEF